MNKLVDEQLEKVDKLLRDDLLQQKDQEQGQDQEPYSRCSQKLEHSPNQQKFMGIIPRTANQGIIRSRNNSKTDLSSNYKYQQEIKQLKEEIKLLKQAKSNH